jgi:hypothetical protein
MEALTLVDPGNPLEVARQGLQLSGIVVRLKIIP